jgi:hypothetical protein
MRSSDRTLLAALGFADKDKKDRRHDLACQYVCQPHVVESLAKTLIGASELSSFRGSRYEIDRILDVKTEHAISKGEGQYKTTVGFMDAFMRVRFRIWHRLESRVSIGQFNECEEEPMNFPFGVEVKIGQTSPAEILRQINLYREYPACPKAFAAVIAFDITESDRRQLIMGRVFAVRLGDGFTKFCLAAGDPAAAVKSI